MLSKTARLKADRAVKAIVRDYDSAQHDLEEYLVDSSYDEANNQNVTSVTYFDAGRSADLWDEWRETVEDEARTLIESMQTSVT